MTILSGRQLDGGLFDRASRDSKEFWGAFVLKACARRVLPWW
jgi:hypothetical protein